MGNNMDFTYTQPLVDMGISLTELAIKGTATAVTNKIRSVKDEKMRKGFVVLMMKLSMNYSLNEMKPFELPKHINRN